MTAPGQGRESLLPVAAEGPVSLVLRPRRTRLVGFLVLSLLFAASGLLARTPAVVLAAAFFGVAAVAFAVMLLPGAAYLRLDAEGFTTCSLFRSRRTSWADVGAFGVTQVSGQEMVGYDSATDAARRPRLAALNAGLSGFTSALPDTYGLGAANLAALMNEARSRALGRR